MTYRRQVEEHLHVCPECDHHYRIGADERVQQLVDTGSFEPLWENVGPLDTLKFTDRKAYADRLVDAQKRPATRTRCFAAGRMSRDADWCWR